MRSTGVGFDGVRREISTQRKELAIMNSQLRSVTKKVDEIAVLADRLTASVVFQRRALVAMSGDITSVLKYVAASGAASSPPTIDGASAVRDAAADGGQMLAATETQNAQWILDLKPKVAEFLLHKLERARGAAVVWVDITDVNVFMQKWTAERFQIVIQDADALLSRCWRLPQRQPRVDAAALAATAYEEESSATMRRNTTMAYRYLHRAVSHFYQRIGNKAVSAFATIVNDKAGLGSLQHVRGTRTKFEVCFEPQEAGALLINDAFITELLYPGGIVRALRVVFSVLCVLHRFSEAAALPARGDVVACLTSHVALVSMKIRAHRKKRAPSELDDGEAVDTTPRLNGGHRAEWVEEMAVVRQRFAPQGARSTNGLRLTDGTEPRRDDPSYREPLASASGAGDRTSAVAAPAVSDGMPSTGADGSPVGDDSGGEELSDADAPGPVDHAAVAAALGAAAHAMAGVYEEVD